MGKLEALLCCQTGTFLVYVNVFPLNYFIYFNLAAVMRGKEGNIKIIYAIEYYMHPVFITINTSVCNLT